MSDHWSRLSSAESVWDLSRVELWGLSEQELSVWLAYAFNKFVDGLFDSYFLLMADVRKGESLGILPAIAMGRHFCLSGPDIWLLPGPSFLHAARREAKQMVGLHAQDPAAYDAAAPGVMLRLQRGLLLDYLEGHSTLRRHSDGPQS